MRVVVTGGAGFIGSHLIEQLVARGDEVLCIERPGASTRWIERLPIQYSEAGIGDVSQLARHFEGADVVFHLAALTQARTPADYYAVNTEGTARVAEAIALHQEAAPRLILLSSLAAVGPNRNGEVLSPHSIPYPLSHYGHSKLLAELVVHSYADRVQTTIIRFPAVYGPRERGVLAFFRLVARGVALTVGPWERQLSMIYVGDAVAGLVAAAAAPSTRGRTYCLAHPTPVTWGDFAGAVGRALGREPRLMSVPSPAAHAIALGAETWAWLRRSSALLNREKIRELVQRRWVCDPSRATNEFGFDPQFGIDLGVSATAAWYRAAGWL